MADFTSYIRFNEEESQVIERVEPFLTIAESSPHYEKGRTALLELGRDTVREDEDFYTIWISPERYREGRKLLYDLVQILMEQREVSWWEKELGTGPTEPIEKEDGFTAVANPRAQIDVLVEARQQQYEQAVSAYNLLCITWDC